MSNGRESSRLNIAYMVSDNRTTPEEPKGELLQKGKTLLEIYYARPLGDYQVVYVKSGLEMLEDLNRRTREKDQKVGNWIIYTEGQQSGNKNTDFHMILPIRYDDQGLNKIFTQDSFPRLEKEIKQANAARIRPAIDLEALRNKYLDKQTNLQFMGCWIGRNTVLLDGLRAFFGSKLVVLAARHRLYIPYIEWRGEVTPEHLLPDVDRLIEMGLLPRVQSPEAKRTLARQLIERLSQVKPPDNVSKEDSLLKAKRTPFPYLTPWEGQQWVEPERKILPQEQRVGNGEDDDVGISEPKQTDPGTRQQRLHQLSPGWRQSTPSPAPARPGLTPSAPPRTGLRSRPSRTEVGFLGTLKEQEKEFVPYEKTSGLRLLHLERGAIGSLTGQKFRLPTPHFVGSLLHPQPIPTTGSLTGQKFRLPTPHLGKSLSAVIRRSRPDTHFADSLLQPRPSPPTRILTGQNFHLSTPRPGESLHEVIAGKGPGTLPGRPSLPRPTIDLGPYKPGREAKEYHALPPETYRKVSAEVDSRFQEQTGILRKLTNGPEDLINRRKWFRIRDQVMREREVATWPGFDTNKLQQPQISKSLEREIMQKGVYVPGVWGMEIPGSRPHPGFDINKLQQPKISKRAEQEIMEKGHYVPGVWGMEISRSRPRPIGDLDSYLTQLRRIMREQHEVAIRPRPISPFTSNQPASRSRPIEDLDSYLTQMRRIMRKP